MKGSTTYEMNICMELCDNNREEHELSQLRTVVAKYSIIHILITLKFGHKKVLSVFWKENIKKNADVIKFRDKFV